jgi:hypothetical protein
MIEERYPLTSGSLYAKVAAGGLPLVCPAEDAHWETVAFGEGGGVIG